MPIVAALAIALVGMTLGSPADLAGANEYGTRSEQVDATTGKLTAPSGLVATASVSPLISDPGVQNSAVHIQEADPEKFFYATQTPQTIPGMMNAIQSGIGGGGGSLVYAYPQAWSFDNKWHPAYRTTVTFDHPVADPIMYLGTFLNAAVNKNKATGDKLGYGITSQQLRIAGAEGPSGEVQVMPRPLESFNSSLYDVIGNTITPKLINGRIPYTSTSAIYCEPRTPQGADSELTLIRDAMPSIADQIKYISGPCGSIQLDTDGKAVTELTVDTDLSYLAASTGMPAGFWNGAGYTATVFNFSTLTELSGSKTPSSLGAATHTVGDLRLGSSIKPAATGMNITQAHAGTSADNSDAGYMPDSQIQHTALTDKSKGTFTVTVPYSESSSTAYLNGWLDFNGNGTWDAGESASRIAMLPSQASSGNATLSFAIPNDIAATPAGGIGSTLRLRVAYDPADVQNPTGMARSGEVEDHFIAISDGTPDLLVRKTASPEAGTSVSVGDIIRYQIEVTNQSTANDANSVTVVDTLPDGLSYLPKYSDATDGLTYDLDSRKISWGPSDIGKGESVTLTLYAQAETAGTKDNTATATTPDGCVTAGASGTPCTDSATINVAHNGRLTLAKTTPGLVNDAVLTLGQQVTYRLTVTNPGPETITNIVVSDPKLAAQGQTCTLETTTLKKGQSTHCDLTYTVAQRDIDTGWVLNHATTSGTYTDGAVAPGDTADKRNDTDGERGALVIKKTSQIKDQGGAVKDLAGKGDTVTYTVVATNESSQTMTNVQIDDPLLPTMGTADNPCTLTGGTQVTFPVEALPAGHAVTCGGSRVVTDKDVDAGHIYNKATGSGTFPPDPDDPTPIPVPVEPGEDEVPVGGLAILKTSTLDGQPITTATPAAKGQVIDYTVTVRNTTDFPMANVVISDPMLTGDEALTCRPDPLDAKTGRNLDAHTSVVCTGSHTVTQDDVDAGRVINTATASGSFAPNPDPDSTRVWPDPKTPIPSPSASTDDPTVRDDTGILVRKSATVRNAQGVSKQQAGIGDTITYTIEATNTGNLTISNVSLIDPMFPDMGTKPGQCQVDSTDVSLPLGSLAPGASIVCTQSHRVTAQDVADGSVYNQSTAQGTIPGPIDPSDPDTPIDPVPVPVTPDDVTVPGGLIVAKVAQVGGVVLGPDDTVKAGDVITYTVRVKNPTPYDMVGVIVSDPMLVDAKTPLDCEATPRTLAARTEFVCTANYTVTQADVDARHVPNTATASGTWAPSADPKAPTGPVDPASASTDTPTDYVAGNLDLDKTSIIHDAADPAKVKQQAELGDRVDYTIIATNTSNVTMKGVSLYDDHWPKLGEGDSTCTVDGKPVRFPLEALPPSAQITCTYAYTVTAADVNAGHVLNVATGEGTQPPDAPDEPDIPIIPTPDGNDIPAGTLQVTKTSKVDGTVVDDSWVDVGATVEYTIVVTNPTTFPMVNVRVADELLTDPVTGERHFSCTGDGTLAPSAFLTCTGFRVVTEADKTAGKITNVAIATADWGPNPGPGSGDEWPTGPVDPAQDKVDNLVPRDVGRLDIDKRAVIKGSDGEVKQTAVEGDEITYTITATNTSESALTNVQLVDERIPELGKADCTIDGKDGTLPASLEAGKKIVCTGTYRVTAQDAAAGHVLNVATGTANTPDPKDPDKDTPADVTPGRDDVPAGTLQVVKTAKFNGVSIGENQKLNRGDKIDYQIVVTNPTTFDMVDVRLQDSMLSDNGTLSCPDLPGPLAARTSTTCTGSYVITQDDVDAGWVKNVATGRAEWAPNPAPDANPDWPTGKVDPATDDTETKTDPGSDKLVIEKSAQIKDARTGKAKETAAKDDVVTYTITATNTSKRTMTRVSIEDPMFSTMSNKGECTVDGRAVTFPVETLAPGGVINCTETHKVTQADVDAGHVYNKATGSGFLPDPLDPPPVVPVPDDVDYPVGGLDVAKKSFLGSTEITDQKLNLGDTVTYQVSVRNPTTYDMTKVSIQDDLLGVGGLTCPGARPDGTLDLKARSTINCTGSYQVTQADVDAGHVLNVAVASGQWVPSDDPQDPSGPVPPGTDQVDDPTDPGAAELTVAKSAEIRDQNTDEVKASAMVGDTVTYTITATNASKQTMSNVVITDRMFPGLGTVSGCAIDGKSTTMPATLPPGETMSCRTPVHTVTAKDADAGHVHNVAVGTGELPPKPDDPYTPVIPEPGTDEADYPVGGLSVEKTSYLGTTPITTQKVELGARITYVVKVTNTSSYRIEQIQVSDPMLAGAGIALDCGRALPTALDGGKSFTCTATYTVTQADVDAGHVVNVAAATGSWAKDPDDPDWPGGEVPGGSDHTDDPTKRAEGSLEISKTSTIADRDSKAAKTQASVGDRITYTVKAKNTSNLTASNVRIEDSLLPDLGTDKAQCSIDRPARSGVQLPTTLAPGATVTCVDTFVVTELDGVNGRVTNVAIAHGDLPGPLDPENPEKSSDPKPLDPAETRNDQPVGGLVVDKVATPSPQFPAAGQTIRYEITVRNTTDYPMVNVALTDSLLDAADVALKCDVGPSGVSLVAHGSFSCAGDYQVTQADVDKGRVLNTATATGEWGPKPTDSPETNWPKGPVEPDSDSTTTPTQGPVAGDGLAITKDAVVNGGAKQKAGLGDVISFSVTATNTSNLTMSDVRVSDEMLAKAGVKLNCEPGNPLASLAPKAKITCTADYTVTVADVNRGSVHNVATGSGEYPDGTDVPVSPGETDTDTEESPGLLEVTKVADVVEVSSGQTFGYTITITNASKDQIAKTVTVNDQLEKYLSFVSADNGGSYNPSTRVVTWKVGPIQPGQSVSVTMKVKASSDLPANATVKNVARAATPTGCAADAPGNCTGESIIPSGSAAGAPLAHTGANIAIAAMIALALLVMGWLLAGPSRRRRPVRR